MKHIKTFKKLFEAIQRPNGYQWTPEHAIETLQNPETAEFPFTELTEESSEYNTSTFLNLLAQINGHPEIKARGIEKLHFVKMMRYITRLDHTNFAVWCLSCFIQVFNLIVRRDFLRLTILFDDHFFSADPDKMNSAMNYKKLSGIVDEHETEEDLMEEVEEVEGTRKNQILTGKDLENAIDAALDRRDFEEVARLSKMMKESFSFDYAVIDDIEEAFRQYLKIFK